MKQSKWLTGQGKTWVFFLLAVALLFLFRSLWTYPIDHTDAMQKYFYSAEILRTGDWSILLHNHHTLRWATMLPQIGLTWLLGVRYEVFYILPLVMFSLYVVLIVFSLKSILSPAQQVMLLTVLLADPISLVISNQYAVTAMGLFFVFAGILLLVRQTRQPILVIVLSAACFFIAYGAHVTYLSFAAGGFLWLVLDRERRPMAFIFGTTLLVLFFLETLVFNYLSDWQFTLGRLEALVNSPHVERNLIKSPVTFLQLLTRWLLLPLPHLLLCLFFIVTGPWLLLQKKRGKRVPAFIECTFLVGFCYAVALTFAVFSIDPIMPVMPIQIRYLIPFVPFAAIMTVFIVSLLGARFLPNVRPRIELAVSLILALVLLILPTFMLDFVSSKFNAFMWSANSQYTEFANKFRDGQLKLTGEKKVAYSMIARFKYPLEIKNAESGLSVLDLSPHALCVEELDQAPLRLNYEDCAD